jgi:hypothetical protein
VAANAERSLYMIRTDAVEIKSINGVAYKQKLAAGGAGITIITPDEKAVFTINKRDGSCVPYGTVNNAVFTEAIAAEALELTRGLPYGLHEINSKIPVDSEPSAEPAIEDEKIAIDVIGSAEYKEFIAQYTDKNGKFSYQIMNKELIQFASKSTVVAKLLSEKEDADVIVRYIVKSKAADLARNGGMEEDMLTAFIDTLDSMDTRSAFKELTLHLRGELGKK